MEAVSDGKQEIKEKDSKPEVKTVEDILKDAERKEDSDYAKHYEKDGGFGQAIKDFEALDLSEIKDTSSGKMGKLPDGRIVNVRPSSSAKKPTLEIYNPKNRRSIKIRYN